MSRFFVALVAALTLGCVTKSSTGLLSRQPALVIETIPLTAEGVSEVQAARLDHYLIHNLTQSLAVRGYQVSELSGFRLRSTWVRDGASEAGSSRTNPFISLSFSVFSPAGDRLFSARSVRSLPLNQWNEARVAAEVRALMRKFPESKLDP